MKTKIQYLFVALTLLAGWPAMSVTQAAGLAATNTPSAIPWNEIGAKAGANYQGDGLAVTPTGSGARLHCVFQRLDGEANSVTCIGVNAFEYCTGLTNSIFPNSVTSIGDNAFLGCSGLTTASFLGNAPPDNGTVFSSDPVTVYYLPGTTGWGSTFGGAPTLLWNPQAQTGDGSFGVQNNQFGFNITGSSNLVIVVEASTNLLNWTAVATNTLAGGTSYFSDPQWTNYPGRFYRFRFP